MKSTAYLFQSTLIVIWWILISIDENIYQFFSFSSITKKAYFNLLVPDLALLGVLSLVRAYWKNRDLSLIILGAFSYATLFCINASFSGLDGLLPTSIMFFGWMFNLFLCYPKKFMRESITKSKRVLAVKTIIQIICFWALFLIAIPLIIAHTVADEVIFTGSPLKIGLSSLGFFLFSVLGLSSGYVMVKFGEGTPLPLDATKKLVIKGPYKKLRNPMAVAGVGQILSIALFFNSFALMFYAILGGIAWHIIVRPIEEADLEKKFGEHYLVYKSDTACWFPKFRKP